MSGDKEDDLMADLREAMSGDVETDEVTEEAVEVAEDAPVEDAPEEEVQEDVEEDLIAPPSDWDDDARSIFETMPDNVQRQFILDRARQAADSAVAAEAEKYRDYAAIKARNDELDAVFQPYEQKLALSGVSRGQAVQRLLAAQDMLEKSPVEAIQWLAQQYHVDLTTAFSPGDEVDPAIAQLQAQVRQLTDASQQTAQTVQQRVAADLQQQIEAFKGATDETGQLMHPHFDLLQPHMSRILNAGQATDLAGAYEIAAKALPQQPKQTVVTAEQKKAAVDKAKRASRNVSTKGKGVAEAVSKGTIADDLNAAWETHA